MRLNKKCEFTAKCLDVVLRICQLNGNSGSFIESAAEIYPESIIYVTMRSRGQDFTLDNVAFTEYKAKKICHKLPGESNNGKEYAVWPVSSLCAGEVLDPSGQQFTLKNNDFEAIDEIFRMQAMVYRDYLVRTVQRRKASREITDAIYSRVPETI